MIELVLCKRNNLGEKTDKRAYFACEDGKDAAEFFRRMNPQLRRKPNRGKVRVVS